MGGPARRAASRSGRGLDLPRVAAILTLVLAGAACHAAQYRSAAVDGAAADFHSLEGAWDITYRNTAMKGPPLQGTWTWRSGGGSAVSDELRLYAASGAVLFVGVSYRIHDAERQRWDVGHVEVARHDGVVAPYDSVGTRAELAAWRANGALHLEERARDTVLHMVFSAVDESRFTWSGEVVAGAASSQRQEMDIVARRRQR